MIVLGIWAATDSLRRVSGGAALLLDPKTFYIVPLGDMFLFGTLVFLAFRARFNPPAHKRLMLIATTALMIAAVARWPFAFIQKNPLWVAELCTYAFLLLLLAYDLLTTPKVHRATLWASPLLLIVHPPTVPIRTPPVR